MLHVDVPEGCTSCGFYKLHTDSTSLTAKSSSPGLSDRTFYACCTIELLHNKLMWFVSIDSWMENCPWSPVDERYWAMLFGINLENAAKLTEMPCAVLKYLFLLFLFFF